MNYPGNWCRELPADNSLHKPGRASQYAAVNLVLAAIAVVVLALAGVGTLALVWSPIREVPRLARLALGYCVGCGVVTLIFFGAYLAGVSFSRWLVVGPVVVLAGVGAAGWTRPGIAPPAERSRMWVWLLPVVLCVLALALSWSRPLYGYDAVMMWGLKAKLAFFARTWPATMFDPYTTAHTEYPPLIPSAQAFVFFWLGKFDDVASRVVFAAFFAAGAVILHWLAGQLRVGYRWVWVLWWCALPATLNQVELTYADMPLAVYLLVFYGAGIAWLREPSRRDWLWLAGIFGGLAFWVKQDALIGVGAGWAALLAAGVGRRSEWRNIVRAGLVTIGLALPWRVFVWTKNLPSDFAFQFADLPARSATVAVALLQHGNVGGGYGFFWVVFGLVLVVGYRELRRPETSWLATAGVIGLVEVFAVYWFSTPNLSDLLQTSLERVLLSLFVPALWLVALLTQRRRAVLMVIAGLAVGWGLFEVYGRTREVVELRREFGGKTVDEQRVLAVEPALRRQIAQSFNSFPPGTHVQVVPKRSLLRHRFYYETYPYLIVDCTATNVIHLDRE